MGNKNPNYPEWLLSKGETPYWTAWLLLCSCLCGHFEKCDVCSYSYDDWNRNESLRSPEDYVKHGYVVATRSTGTRAIHKRELAEKMGWKIEEITDLLKDRKYIV